jgi:hypothetical protein
MNINVVRIVKLVALMYRAGKEFFLKISSYFFRFAVTVKHLTLKYQ